MQFSENWLRTFSNPPLNSKELAELLTNAGMEVEEQSPVAPPFTKVVIAEILEAEKHPNADRLRVCKVNAGPHSPNGPLQIVCGAPNARPGIKIPLALIGADLPPVDGKPFSIKQGLIRGVESFGMLCSCDELGIEGNSEGLLELPGHAPIGQDIRHYLNLDDTLFTLKLTPNLGHCLSIRGIARELASLTKTKLEYQKPKPSPVSISDAVRVSIKAPELCGRFSARVIKNINTKVETPAWIKDRLSRSGQRPVSVLVDISNYVMFEMGSPNHIFDFDRIKSDLSVRWARPGESLLLLNGKTVELNAQYGIVADGDTPEALAGIMGGESASVQDNTTNIVVESAFWYPESIMGKARSLGFSSEASHRFERGVDPEQTIDCIERITELVISICGGQAGPITDVRATERSAKTIQMRIDRASKVIGLSLDKKQVEEIFGRLGFEFTETQGVFKVTPPSYRFDIEIEADLIEEVVRLIGYNNLPQKAPKVETKLAIQPENSQTPTQLKRKIANLGYQETINYSFVERSGEENLMGNKNPIELLNPIAAPLSVMRSTLFGSLLSGLSYNLSRKAQTVRIFELGRVFKHNAAIKADLKSVHQIEQPRLIGGLAYGPSEPELWGNKKSPVDFYDVKADLEAFVSPIKLRFAQANHPALHPGRSADILINNQVVGYLGQLHPKWQRAYDLPQAPILFELMVDPLLTWKLPSHKPVSRFNAITRDLAFIIPDTTKAQDLVETMKRSDKSGIIKSVTVFDVYKPQKATGDIAEHERSIALRMLIENDKEQMTDDQIQSLVKEAIKAAEKHQARLRA